MKRLIILAAVFLVGCTSQTVETPAVMVDVPPFLPTYSCSMTIVDAVAVLKLTPPVRVVHAASFEDGGTVEISIQDSKGEGYAFRRAPWARDEPVSYFIDFPKKGERPERLEWNDPRLKALSILALNWVDCHYSRKQQRQIFAGEYLKEQPFDGEKARASTVLWLFRKEELDRQQ